MDKERLIGKVNQRTRILVVLADGNWHSGLEFTRLPKPILGYTMRIHELRLAGYIIVREWRNKLWQYKLMGNLL